jgi:hypothetical protein
MQQKQTELLIFSGLVVSTKDYSPEVGLSEVFAEQPRACPFSPKMSS